MPTPTTGPGSSKRGYDRRNPPGATTHKQYGKSWHSSAGNRSSGGQQVPGVTSKYRTRRVAWEACRDHHRFLPGAFVWGRGVLPLGTAARRPAAYSRKTAAACSRSASGTAACVSTWRSRAIRGSMSEASDAGARLRSGGGSQGKPEELRCPRSHDTATRCFSDVGFLGDLKRVVDLDAEIAHGRLNFFGAPTKVAQL